MEVSTPNYLEDNALFIITRELCMKVRYCRTGYTGYIASITRQ